MTEAFFAGGLAGLGLYLLVRSLLPSRPGFGARADDSSRLRGRVGRQVAAFYAARGWHSRSLRADVNLLGRSWEGFLATKVLYAVGVMVLAPFLFVVLAAAGIGLADAVPVWLALALGAIAFFLPDVSVRQEAAVKRRDFRHVVGAYLDLVSMGLAGGRGVP